MTRWKRLAIKLLALAAVAVLVCFTLNAVLRRALISAGESATGAKMEIGRLDSSLLVGQVTLGDVRFADPHEPTRNLLEIGEVSLDLETSALLKRKLVAGALFGGALTATTLLRGPLMAQLAGSAATRLIPSALRR